MTQTMINGGTQIRSNTITSGQVASSIIVAAGTNPFTATQSMGGFGITSLASPVNPADAATKGYVDSLVQGFSGKYSAVAATNTESLTITSGTVTTISGTTVNGISPNINDYVLVLNAPSATGAAGGSTLSSQPANGLYQVSANTTNLTVTRAADMSGAASPLGAYVFVVGGSQWGGAGFVVTTPSTSAAFTYGTGAIAFTQFSGAGEVTTDATLTKTGNQLARAAISGNVSIPAGSNTATIGAGQVTVSMISATGTASSTTYLRGDGTWSAVSSGGGGTVTSLSVVSANGFTGTVANATTTPAITIETTVTGLLKGNGTAISAAVAGTDYLAPSDLVTREKPGGTINGSTTAFTLANAPISGTEMLFQNGLLLESGTGNDYTISGANITMASAPLSGDVLYCTYWH